MSRRVNERLDLFVAIKDSEMNGSIDLLRSGNIPTKQQQIELTYSRRGEQLDDALQQQSACPPPTQSSSISM